MKSNEERIKELEGEVKQLKREITVLKANQAPLAGHPLSDPWTPTVYGSSHRQ